MAKGSQLTQLKSALSQAGITRPPQNGKKRKRSGIQEEDKEKKATKLNAIQQKLNPFDVKVTKLKHDVGGRKLKGVMGRPAQSKQAGLEQRKKTLLKEYEEKDRTGGIVDRRFGENDPTMSLEERMLQRFTKERQRSARGKAVFNLEDEDELTHYGQSLSKLDDFDNAGLGEDDEDEVTGQIDRDIVRKTHFGGFDDDDDEDGGDQPARKKSKAEVMTEVMAKSKEHKLRRQIERDHEENVRHELDQEFDSLRELLFVADPSSTGSNSVPLGVPHRSEVRNLVVTAPPQEEGANDYDLHVRELVFDKRAKPKDRTKTEEELALEEKEALEKAERKRRRRMLGEDEEDSGDESCRPRGKRKRMPGGDDLDDDFQEEDEWKGLGTGLGGDESPEAGSDEESGSDDGAEGEDDDDSQGGPSDEEGDTDENDSDNSEGELGDQEDLVSSKKAGKVNTSRQGSSKELPYTFPSPSSHEEFLEIVEDVEDKDVPTVVQRIRSLYHPSLAPENNKKLQALSSVLIDHILHITSPPSPRFTLVSSLLPHLFALSQSFPIQSAEFFVEKLSLMHKNLKRGLSHGSQDPRSKTFPGLAELSFLHTIGLIWPTSDMNHPVISPTRLLMGAYLGLARVRSLADVASGLFLCTLFLQFEQLSKRLVPEAINFVINSVLHLAPHSYRDIASLPGSFPSPDFQSLSLTVDTKFAKSATLKKPVLLDIIQNADEDEQAKVDLLELALDLVGRFAELYKGLDSFIELYQPISDIIGKVESKKLAEGHKSRIKTLKDTLTRLLKFAGQSRRPLLLQSHKPIPIATYIPKFETSSSSYMRRQDPDHDRNEAAKLRSQYKQERKGAIRELRKDARFLAGVEQQKQREKDRQYKDSMKRVFGSIEGERAEEKAMEREKSRDKKRAGRK